MTDIPQTVSQGQGHPASPSPPGTGTGSRAVSVKDRQRLQVASRYADEMKNPCLNESERSMKCMSDTGFDRDKCTLYFKNYRNCLDFWARIRRERHRKGIKPDLPLPEDRDHIKREFWDKVP